MLSSVSLLQFFFLVVTSHAQEKPFFNVKSYDDSISHRHSFCTLHRLVDDESISRKDALQGMNLHVSLFDYQLNSEGVIDETNPSIGVRIMDELARRAGFQFRNTFGVITVQGNQTFDDILDWSSRVYDINSEFWMTTSARLERGIKYPADGWYDGDIIMVHKADDAIDKFQLFAFAAPFTSGVWLILAMTVVISAMVYFCLDYIDSIRLGEEIDQPFSKVLFTTADSFVGNFGYNPKSTATRIVVLSSTFLFLLFLQSYTANLASFLVVRNNPGVQITDLNEAVMNQQRICFWATAATELFFRQSYPSYTKAIPNKDGNVGILRAVRDGDCDIALINAADWLSFERNGEVNPNCELKWIGRVVRSYGAGFALADDIDLCSSLLTDVLDLHMLDMISDGSLDRIWKYYRKTIQTIHCDSTNENDLTRTTSLSVANMGGIVAFHAVILVVALMCSLFTLFFIEPRTKRDMIGDRLSGISKSFLRKTKVWNDERFRRNSSFMIPAQTLMEQLPNPSSTPNVNVDTSVNLTKQMKEFEELIARQNKVLEDKLMIQNKAFEERVMEKILKTQYAELKEL